MIRGRAMILRSIVLIAAAAAAALASPCFAQSPAQPLFANSAPLNIAIDAPFATLFSDRESDRVVAGLLIDDAGNRLPIRLNLRGITRRTTKICDVPPLAIRFDSPPPANSAFAGQKKLKLVTHCRSAGSSNRLVLLEYAAYRLYNVLTPKSFDARLATITYREPDGKPVATRPGFFIEDIKEVARRNGLAEAHGGVRVPLTTLSAPDSALYGLFQHMIANHDWSMRAGPAGEDCCHNAKLIGGLAPGQAIPVPYDFDFSGFVDAPYAFPPEQLNLSSVKQRKYRGYCAHNQSVLAAAKLMHDKQGAMMAELAAIPGLDRGSAAKAAAFVQPFFSEIASDSAVQANILANCSR